MFHDNDNKLGKKTPAKHIHTEEHKENTQTNEEQYISKFHNRKKEIYFMHKLIVTTANECSIEEKSFTRFSSHGQKAFSSDQKE